MNKKIKKLLVIFFFMFFMISNANASLLWDIEYGIKEFKKNNLYEAKNYLENYVKSNPNSEDGYYWLGRTYFNLDDKTNSTKNFKMAYEIAKSEKNIEKITFYNSDSSNLEDYFDMASMYFETGNYKEANLYTDMMLNINPKSYGAYFIKAKIAQVSGQTDVAIENINKAIFFNNKLIKTNLAKSLDIKQIPQMSLKMYEIMALESAYSDDIEKAIQYCKKYLSIDNKNNDIKNLLVSLYIKNNELLLAQSVLCEMSETTKDIQTLINQIKLYELRKDKRELETIKEAYEINPNNSQILLLLGNYYLKNNDFENAKKYFEILVNVNDELYEGYYGYIDSLIELNEIEKATSLIRKLVSINKNASDNLYLLAKICEKSNNYKDALDYISEAIEKTNNPYFLYKRAELNYKTKNYENSIRDLKNLLKCNLEDNVKQNIEILIIKNYLKLSDYRNAQTLINKKLSLDKNRILYKYYLHVLYKLQGDNVRALNELNELKKIKPQTITDYIDLKEMYLEENKPKEAKKVIVKALKKFQDPVLNIEKFKIDNILNSKNNH